MSEKNEVIEKKVVEVREFVRGLPEEIQYEAACRIQSEAEILALFGPDQIKNEAEPVVTDFLDEFKDALFHQLISDHNRWGNTWLNRPKEGQELRTKARYEDYFDQFELGKPGIPVPWLKVVGEALICWIRDNHPELHLDPDGSVCSGHEEVIAEDMKAIGFREGEDVGKHNPRIPLVNCQACRDAGLVKDIVTPILHDLVPAEKPVEDMTTKELVESRSRPNPISHVVGEKVEKSGLGKLSYSPRSEGDGKIILDSVVFTKANVAEYPDEDVVKLGTCDKDGCIIPASKAVGVLGRVSSNGQYRLSLVSGVGGDDTIFVSYTYEYQTSRED